MVKDENPVNNYIYDIEDGLGISKDYLLLRGKGTNPSGVYYRTEEDSKIFLEYFGVLDTNCPSP